MSCIAHDRFPVCTFDTLDPEYVEDHNDLYTATQWTMHLKVPTNISVQDFALKVILTGAEMLTGDYIGGDSFREWGKKSIEEDDRAIHMYLAAPTLATAQIALRNIYQRLDNVNINSKTSHLTTGKDWAEGVNPWANS